VEGFRVHAVTSWLQGWAAVGLSGSPALRKADTMSSITC
jgi:hypothetical protein